MKQSQINEILSYLNEMFPYIKSEREMYSLLIYYRLPRIEIRQFFNNWIKYFKNKNNISVFVSDDWPYFCQFINGEETADKMLKLYIPLSLPHIEQGAKIIFEFLRKNKIHHRSKIGSHLRNDNLVIRVNSLNDAKKVIEFVKNNAFLQKALLPTNPFIFNQHGVGLAMDGFKSYNFELSKLLFDFFRERQLKGSLAAPCVNEFGKYLLSRIDNNKNPELSIIYRTIYLNAINENFSFEHFSDLADNYQDNFELLTQALIKTKRKYGDKQMMIALIGMLNNNFKYLTNDDNIRHNAKRYLSGEQVKSIINRVCGYNRNRNIDQQIIIDTLVKVEELSNSLYSMHVNTLAFALRETANRIECSDYELRIRLKTFIANCNFCLFTRANGARDAVKKVFSEHDDILKIINEELGLPERSSIDKAVEEFFNQKMLDKEIKRIG